MIRVVLIRHGVTDWNAQQRIQGHTDIALSDAGRRALERRRLPSAYRGWPVYSSPLSRALQTAELLGLRNPARDPRLMEMAYGEWEGSTREELEQKFGGRLPRWERRGLDFRPRGGESPRELRARLGAWLEDVRRGGQSAVAVTHKGVIRMALAMATGWDLTSRAPERLLWDRAHAFGLPGEAPGGIRVAALNIEFEPA